jgi:hypothetical protein
MEEELIGVKIEHNDYWEWEGFDGVLMEDSCITEIRVGEKIVFVGSFQLTDAHPAYTAGKAFKGGQIEFDSVSEYVWTGQHVKPQKGKFKKKNLGGVDAMFFENGWYYTLGEWGELRFRAESKAIKIRK